MKDTQLHALLQYLEESTYQAYLQEPQYSCGRVIENIPYDQDHHPMHTLDILYPKTRKTPYPLIVYLHGGGFCMHSKDDIYRSFATRLAQDEFAIVNINYRLALEVDYSTILSDVKHAIDYIVSHAKEYQLDSSCMFLAGDSAGAYLAVSHALSYPLSSWKGIACFCGLYDFQTFLTDSQTKFPIKKEMISLLFPQGIPYTSSILSQLSKNMPPIYLMDSEYKSFANESKRLYAQCQTYDIPCQIHLYPKEDTLPHNFQLWSKYPQSKQVIEEVFQWCHQILSET